MPQIIQISPDERVEAIRRSLARIRREMVALDLPENWPELANPARLRILQRQALLQHNQLALVTRHESTHKAARQLGIPVFTRLEQLPRRGWRMAPPIPSIDAQNPAAALPEPPPWRRLDMVKRVARPSLHQTRQERIQAEEIRRRPLPYWLRSVGYLAMGSLIVLVLAFFVFYVLPAATITLVPGRELLAVDVPLTADPNLDVADLDAGLIPGRLVERTIEQSGSIATSGSQQKPSVRASGTVVFSNLGTAPVEIPVGTVVGTSTGIPVEFRTVAAGRVDGGVGARTTVPVEAVEPGIQGNVRANTINTVSGALRFRLRVINSNGTFGGGSELVPVVTQQDKDNLLEQVLATVEGNAYAYLQEELQPEEWLPPESVQTYVEAQIFDKFNDDEGDRLNLSLRVLIQGTALAQSELTAAVEEQLRRNVPEFGMLVADTVSVQREPGAAVIDRSVQFTMTGVAEYVIPIDPSIVKSAVAGLTPEAATSEVASRWSLEREPEIYRDPQWLSTLPAFPSRIQVRVEYAESVTVPATSQRGTVSP